MPFLWVFNSQPCLTITKINNSIHVSKSIMSNIRVYSTVQIYEISQTRRLLTSVICRPSISRVVKKDNPLIKCLCSRSPPVIRLSRGAQRGKLPLTIRSPFRFLCSRHVCMKTSKNLHWLSQFYKRYCALMRKTHNKAGKVTSLFFVVVKQA